MKKFSINITDIYLGMYWLELKTDTRTNNEKVFNQYELNVL
jgi:hypothetical protein